MAKQVIFSHCSINCLSVWVLMQPASNETVSHYTYLLNATLLKYSISEFLPSTVQSGSASGMKIEVFLAHV